MYEGHNKSRYIQQCCIYSCLELINTLRPRQSGCRFEDSILKSIFLNENVSILIKISLKFYPWGPINNIPPLVQVMAWHQSGDKLLSEPMMVRLLTHLCINHDKWRYEQNGWHVTDDTRLVCTRKLCIFIWISRKFVSKHPIANKLALVQLESLVLNMQHLNQCWPSSVIHISNIQTYKC